MYRLNLTNSGKGEIQIGDYKESFVADLTFWEKANYEAQWANATETLKSGVPVLFITSITDPDSSNFILTWACYPKGGELVFQQQILFLDNLDETFELSNPYKSVLPYESETEDGHRISEWRTNA